LRVLEIEAAAAIGAGKELHVMTGFSAMTRSNGQRRFRFRRSK
jgi:hypothetical protein